MNISYTVVESPLGPVYAAESKSGLLCVCLGPGGYEDLVAYVRRHYGDSRIVPDVIEATGQLAEYLCGRRRRFDLSLDLKGTAFQISVWQALQKIPYGRTWSYGQVAQAVGQPKAARAVGRACGANPIPLVIPCHRVVGADGDLTGFGSGLEWKEWLLELEKPGAAGA